METTPPKIQAPPQFSNDRDKRPGMQDTSAMAGTSTEMNNNKDFMLEAATFSMVYIHD